MFESSKMVNCFVFQDAALVAMRSEVVAEITKLRNQELEQAQQELRQQLQQQVPLHITCDLQQPFTFVLLFVLGQCRCLGHTYQAHIKQMLPVQLSVMHTCTNS